MMAARPQFDDSPMTEAEYLAFERASEVRHEYVDGVVCASRERNLIVLNTGAELRTLLRKRNCEVYVNDMRVKLPERATFTYPDIVVTCETPQFADDEFDSLLNPTIIFEVLSSPTEGYDRGKKFQHCRTIASLQTYILISQGSPHVEHYLQQADGSWLFTDTVGSETTLALLAIQAEIPLADTYEKVSFGKANPTPPQS